MTDYDKMKEAAEALIRLNTFGAVVALLEGGTVPSGSPSADRTTQQIIALCKAGMQRQLELWDKLAARDKHLQEKARNKALQTVALRPQRSTHTQQMANAGNGRWHCVSNGMGNPLCGRRLLRADEQVAKPAHLVSGHKRCRKPACRLAYALADQDATEALVADTKRTPRGTR